MWFAEVPFEDGSGSKDRPVLVLSAGGRSCEVARFTSQDKNGRRDHVRVPQGIPGLPKASWLNLRPTSLPRSAFRRRTGRAGRGVRRLVPRRGRQSSVIRTVRRSTVSPS